MKIKFFIEAEDFPKQEVDLDLVDAMVFDQIFMGSFCLSKAQELYGEGWATRKFDVSYGFEITDEEFLKSTRDDGWIQA